MITSFISHNFLGSVSLPISPIRLEIKLFQYPCKFCETVIRLSVFILSAYGEHANIPRAVSIGVPRLRHTEGADWSHDLLLPAVPLGKLPTTEFTVISRSGVSSRRGLKGNWCGLVWLSMGHCAVDLANLLILPTSS